jgi:hypothetical protein
VGDEAVDLGTVLFYLGEAMIVAYFSAFPAAALSLLLLGALKYIDPRFDSDDARQIGVFLGVLALLGLVFAQIADGLGPPSSFDSFGRTFMRLLGVVGIGLIAWGYREVSRRDTAETHTPFTGSSESPVAADVLIARCPRCQTPNRIPSSAQSVRCGKCTTQFEVAHAE